jgi:hypothetical protein
VPANAQLRGLRDRIKQRAEDRVEQRATQEIDKQVDKAVDAAFDASMDKVSDMINASFAKNRTTVDLENNVVKSEGQPDINLTPNETSPANAEYVQYLSVTVYHFPEQLGQLLGNGSYEHVYLHGDRMLSRSPAAGSLIDLDEGNMAFLDYEEGTYWIQSFAELGAMAGDFAEQLKESQSAPGATESPDVDVEVDVDVRKGKSGVVRGSDAQQHFMIVQADIEADDPETGSTHRGTVFSVSEVWTSDNLAGSATIGDFGVRMGQAMGQVAGAMGGGGLESSMLGDQRITAAFEEASEQLDEFDGTPVQTRMWMVMVPTGKELDLDRVLAEEEADMESWAASLSQESEEEVELTDQVTLFSSTTFISNLTTEAFGSDVLEVSPDLEQVPSPLEQMRQMQGAN